MNATKNFITVTEASENLPNTYNTTPPNKKSRLFIKLLKMYINVNKRKSNKTSF